MKEAWRNFIEKKGIKKWFHRDNLIIIILSGALLLIISLPTDSISGKNSYGTGTGQGSRTESVQQKETQQREVQQKASQQNGGTDNTVLSEDYGTRLEQRLQAMLEGMEGVGKVQVMITFQSSEEQVVEKDQPMTRANTTESDAQGGSRSVYQTDSGEETIYYTNGEESQPYVVKTLMPRVEGVVVSAQGAGTGEVSRNITEAVQALFGIEAHKIKVIKSK